MDHLIQTRIDKEEIFKVSAFLNIQGDWMWVS